MDGRLFIYLSCPYSINHTTATHTPHNQKKKTARGWASVLQGNPLAQRELRAFFARPDTWSLGLCNGCQLLAALGVVPGLESDGGQGVLEVALAENESGRFESRFVSVRVEESGGGTPAVLLRGMEGAVLGMWSAHGEGRFAFRDGDVSGVGGLEMGACPIDHQSAHPFPSQITPPTPDGTDAGPCPRAGPRPAPLRGPEPARPGAHRGVPPQPQRLPRGDCRAVLALRAASGRHAPPGAVLAGVAGGLRGGSG